jgi:predicted aldo/keto reductase-like oxidoreductase
MELNKILIGTMRLPERKSAVTILRRAIDSGFNYIDTSPLYRFKSGTECSECWINEAINYRDFRERVFVSTKSAVSDGGLSLGNFEPQKGFGVRTKEQFKLVYQQSLKRLGIDSLDFYHLWICHTMEQFNEFKKPDGWLHGYREIINRPPPLGLTTHGDSETVIKMLESGLFSTVTIPLNIINTSRMKIVEYCRKTGIKVLAMNPLAGGLLAQNEKLKELALMFLMALDNVHLLIGFTREEEVDYAKWILDQKSSYKMSPKEILKKAKSLIQINDSLCTGCGYCQPCSQFIDIGASLSYYNLYKYLKVKEAKRFFLELQWNPRYKLDNCSFCGSCESRCPNHLPVRKIIKDAQTILYK